MKELTPEFPPYYWWLRDRNAPDCSDQLPVISTVGQGLTGDSFRVLISDPDTLSATYLEGQQKDEASDTWSKVWESDNINGGQLTCYHNLRPWSIPQMYTLTFIYRRDNRLEWAFTTPAMPYVWDANGDGEPDVDNLVGSGVGNLFTRTGPNDAWKEQLKFPPGTTAADFNAPGPEEVWAVSLSFGWGEDIEVPNIYDLAKIIGVDVQVLINILNDVPGAFDGYDNLKLYIDAKISNLQTQIDNINQQISQINTRLTNIENRQDTLENTIKALGDKYNKALADILSKIYGGGTMNPDTGAITWGRSEIVPVGNLNIYGGTNRSNYIISHANPTTNDIWEY